MLARPFPYELQPPYIDDLLAHSDEHIVSWTFPDGRFMRGGDFASAQQFLDWFVRFQGWDQRKGWAEKSPLRAALQGRNYLDFLGCRRASAILVTLDHQR